MLTGAELRRRYPGYHLPADTLALFQPDGGFLRPERCIVAYVKAAQALGAEIHGHERVLEWEPAGDGRAGAHRPRRLRGRTSWWSAPAPGTATWWTCLRGLIVPERQVLAWLQPTMPEYFQPERFPVFNLLVEEGRFYGFPVFDVPGFKFGKYHHLQEWGPADLMDREAARLRRGAAAAVRRALLPRRPAARP